MVAQLNSSLLIVSVISLIIPAAFVRIFTVMQLLAVKADTPSQHLYLEDKLSPGTEVAVLLQLSHGSAIILILM